MKVQASQLAARFRASVAVNDRVQAEATQRTLGRVVAICMWMVSVNIIYIIWFLGFQLPDAVGTTRLWVQWVGATHAVSAVAMVVLGLLAHYATRSATTEPPHSPTSQAPRLVLHTTFMVLVLLFGVSLSVADQLVATNVTIFSLVGLAVAMLSLMRPGLAVMVYVAAYLVLYFCLPLTQHDPQLLAISRSHAVSAIVVSVLASVIMWRQFVHGTVLGWEVQSTQAALAVKQAELEFLATHDVLTGLVNRRELMRQLEREYLRTQRQPCATSVILVDLDFFKKINDSYGHPAGDAVLVAVATTLAHGVRQNDVVARLGGEEFFVLLPNTDLVGAAQVAQKLRTLIRDLPIAFENQQLRVTASFGVSCQDAPTTEPLDSQYAAADRALYVAKHSGRDRVELAQSPAQSAFAA